MGGLAKPILARIRAIIGVQWSYEPPAPLPTRPCYDRRRATRRGALPRECTDGGARRRDRLRARDYHVGERGNGQRYPARALGAGYPRGRCEDRKSVV